MHGLVIKNTGSWYTVYTDDGQLIDSKIKGNFRLKGIRSTNPVAVGDRVVVDLPLETKLSITEIIRRCRQGSRGLSPRLGFCPTLDRLTYAVSVIVFTDYRPAIFPGHRLKMDNSAKGIPLLEMKEPPLAIRGVHNSALVRAVDPRGACFQDDFPLIRAIYVL